MKQTKVFLNSWYFYNGGCIGFGWMTTDEARTFMEAHENDTRFEEWFIVDIGNYCGIEVDDLEYCNISAVLDDIDALESMTEFDRGLVQALQELHGKQYTITEEFNQKDDYIAYSDFDEFKEFIAENDLSTYFKNIPSSITDYFDLDGYCEMLIRSDYYQAENGYIILDC